MKLTDTQLVLLSTASQRDDRAVELNANIKGGAARKLIGKLLSGGLIEEVPARGGLPVWRKDGREGAQALRVTERGLHTIGLSDTQPAGKGAAEPTEPPPAHEPAKQARAAHSKHGSKPAKSPKRNAAGSSKQDRVLEMLRLPTGTTIPAIMKATGWQQHSVRGFFAGVVRKKLKLKLLSDKTDGDRVYRIPSGKSAKPSAKARVRA
jgi:hypothetical protein